MAPVKKRRNIKICQKRKLWADPGSSYGPLACKMNTLALSYYDQLLDWERFYDIMITLMVATIVMLKTVHKS